MCLESQLHHLLIDYVTSSCAHLLDDASPDVDEETVQSIVTSCSVLLNIVVSEPVLQTEDSAFKDFLSFLVQILPGIGKLTDILSYSMLHVPIFNWLKSDCTCSRCREKQSCCPGVQLVHTPSTSASKHRTVKQYETLVFFLLFITSNKERINFPSIFLATKLSKVFVSVMRLLDCHLVSSSKSREPVRLCERVVQCWSDVGDLWVISMQGEASLKKQVIEL